MNTYILIPTYNEAQNIALLSQNLNNAIPNENKFFVFVDDNSKDTTVDQLKKYFDTNRTVIIEKDQNKGPGDSFNQGFEWIIAHSDDSDDIIVTMEADNTSDIGILDKMITISKLGYELVLASPYAQGGGFEKTTFFRKAISFVANMFLRSLFDIKVLTLSSFYRVYKIGLIKTLKEKYGNIILEKGFICMIEILIKAIRQKAAIIEVPMTLKSDNRQGKSKMKVFKTMISYIKFFIKNINKYR